jgi:hypothetical protein
MAGPAAPRPPSWRNAKPEHVSTPASLREVYTSSSLPRSADAQLRYDLQKLVFKHGERPTPYHVDTMQTLIGSIARRREEFRVAFPGSSEPQFMSTTDELTAAEFITSLRVELDTYEKALGVLKYPERLLRTFSQPLDVGLRKDLEPPDGNRVMHFPKAVVYYRLGAIITQKERLTSFEENRIRDHLPGVVLPDAVIDRMMRAADQRGKDDALDTRHRPNIQGLFRRDADLLRQAMRVERWSDEQIEAVIQKLDALNRQAGLYEPVIDFKRLGMNLNQEFQAPQFGFPYGPPSSVDSAPGPTPPSPAAPSGRVRQ